MDLSNWIYLSLLSALLFGLGDFTVVYSNKYKMDVVNLYIVYTIIVGLINLLFVLFRKPDVINAVKEFNQMEWIVVGIFCFTYLFAYLTHFIAIQKASNPGYASALVMFHVVVLTVLSYFFLNKPINSYTIFGMILTIIGALLVTTYSE